MIAGDTVVAFFDGETGRRVVEALGGLAADRVVFVSVPRTANPALVIQFAV